MNRTPARLSAVVIAVTVVVVALPTLLINGLGTPLILRSLSAVMTNGTAQAASQGPAQGHVVDDTQSAALTLRIGPIVGSTVRDKISIEAIPVHAQAVSQIYFYVDSTFEGTDLAAPYCLRGTSDGTCGQFDTTKLANGNHVVKAYMSYNKGSLESDATFAVANSAPAAPPTTTNPPPASTAPHIASPSTTSAPTRSATTTPYVGLNVYELASDPGVNLGCGASFNGQWASFFSSLPTGTVVRFWATQQMATSAASPGQLNWTALDSVFSSAATYHVHLIPVLGNEWTDCDGTRAVQKQLSWFQGGFRSNTDEGPISYLSWVRGIVARYANSPATYLWEPMNEAQAANGNGTCTEPSAAGALRSFYDAVGATIHSIDSKHKVESGLLGEGNCGTENADYASVGASSGIDVLSYHDYYPPGQGEGGDQWNGIAVRIAQAAADHKPILVGEDGISAGTGCGESLNQRAIDFQKRARAQFAAGAVGMLFWDWEKAPSNCSYDIGPGDPSLQLLRGVG
jgi:hypothetical protein